MMFSLSFPDLALICFALPFVLCESDDLQRRSPNGLALTPPMGFNTYNAYSCLPNDTILYSNAQALVDLGLDKTGYHYFTIDCGWANVKRSANGTLGWNATQFPTGVFAMSNFLHTRGLGFGVYSDGGTYMCKAHSLQVAGSLNHETVDANTFAEWGADLLKYDNCYSNPADGYARTDYAPPVSPSSHYVTMSNALLATKRPIVFAVCEWGVDFPAAWAPAVANSWRATNDIVHPWRNIPRILNQVVPQTEFAGPGHWMDMDLLEVGQGLTLAEDQTHFALWAICKSPLFISTVLKDAYTSVTSQTLSVLMNQDVISYNQDSLGVAASFRRRWTNEGYEIWAGPLSGNRTVVAIINTAAKTQTLTFSLPDVGWQSAGSVKDVWNKVTVQNVQTSYTASAPSHGTLLLELMDTQPAGTYDFKFAQKLNSLETVYESIYGITSSSNYSVTITFSTSSSSPQSIVVTDASGSPKTVTLPAQSTSLTLSATLLSSNHNNITIKSAIAPTSLEVTNPPEKFYPATSFSLSGGASLATCSPKLCVPVGSKVTKISSSGKATVTLSNLTAASSSLTTKYAEVYFCNNNIAFADAWSTGTNTLTLSISVNGVTNHIEVPLSGKSSELFSPGKGWEDTGIFKVLLQGFKGDGGKDVVVVSNAGSPDAGADLVGLSVMW